MLVAITEQNERFVIQTSIRKETLKQLRKEKQFFCPQCKSNVQLKIGAIKIPHFAHLTKSECETHFSEGETAQHILGKEHLYQFFQRLGFHVELESYLPTLKQRPDLLVKMNDGNRIAIEYQCSSIPNADLMLRTNGYLTNNILPIWIPSTPTSKSLLTGIITISLNEQLQQFIQSTKNQHYLLTYNPYKQQFTYMTNLLHLKGNQFISKIQNLPLAQQLFPFYLPKKLTKDEFSQYFNTYLNSKGRYVNYRLLISKKGVNDLFLRSLYELRLSLTALPIFIGVPLKGNEFIKEFAVEWQTTLFYFVHLNRLEINFMNRQAIEYFLKWANLNISKESITTVSNYCKLLNQLKIQHVYSSIESENLKDLLYAQFVA